MNYSKKFKIKIDKKLLSSFFALCFDLPTAVSSCIQSSLNWNNKLQKLHGWQASFYFVDKDLSLPPEGYLHRTNRVKNQEMLTKI